MHSTIYFFLCTKDFVEKKCLILIMDNSNKSTELPQFIHLIFLSLKHNFGSDMPEQTILYCLYKFIKRNT